MALGLFDGYDARLVKLTAESGASRSRAASGAD